MTQYDIIQALAAKARALSGIRAAPDDPPDTALAYPFAVTYFQSGSWRGDDATWKTAPQTFAIDLYMGRYPDAGRILATYSEYPESLGQAIVSDENLTAAVTMVKEVRCRFARMNYIGIDCFGYHFEIDVTAISAKA